MAKKAKKKGCLRYKRGPKKGRCKPKTKKAKTKRGVCSQVSLEKASKKLQTRVDMCAKRTSALERANARRAAKKLDREWEQRVIQQENEAKYGLNDLHRRRRRRR